MRAPKLVQLMKANSSALSEALVQKIRACGQCVDLLFKVPETEHKEYALEIFQDLTQWLGHETDSILERRYVALGIRRVEQGVPLSQVFWAVTIAREFLWDYTQQQCLHEEPVEFWGGVLLLRSLNSFFDRALYYLLIGYEKVGKDEAAALSFLAQRRSA